MVVPTCPTVRPGRRAAADRVLDVVPGPQIPERSRMRCAAFVIRHADLVGLGGRR
nr:hypothetical protein [Mycobacterium pseudoshottsii]